MKHPLCSCVAVLALASGLLGQIAVADSTAFDLIKEGDQYVGTEARDKVVQIRSEKSIGTLIPNIWYVVYYDTTATLKATEVKFGGGKMMEVKHPWRLLEPVTGGDQTLDRKKLKIDSDRALAIALKDPLLPGLNLKATQFRLDHGDHSPVWRIRLWAAKLGEPNKMADIGEVIISSDTGEVVRSDLHPKSVD
ncbi:MAG TPA: hypothetical protein VMR33_16655 [Candidatus Baltobacteraceae bacterium]|nr:hypothetical protein [Candidatus Baltobacteraceae bacterium]